MTADQMPKHTKDSYYDRLAKTLDGIAEKMKRLLK